MAETTIEWCASFTPAGERLGGYTFNAWIGCEKVSPGCKNCYASVDTFARASRARGLELWGGHAHRHVTSDAYWKKPLRWNRAAEEMGVRRKVFCASLSDVFEDRDDLLDTRTRLADVIGQTPWLDWLLLTKRPENARRLWTKACGGTTKGPCVCGEHGRSELMGEVRTNTGRWADNIWIGTTAEDQKRADERIPHLLRVPAAVRFLSCEPLLGPVDLVLRGDSPNLPDWDEDWKHNVLTGKEWASPRDDRDPPPDAPRVHWVIVGGESGPGARPMHPAWARRLRDQCAAARVPFLFKQHGEFVPDEIGEYAINNEGHFVGLGTTAIRLRRAGKKAAGRILDGQMLDQFPEERGQNVPDDS